MDVFVRSISPAAGTVFEKTGVSAPQPAAKPRPPLIIPPDPPLRLTALPPQTIGVCRNIRAGVAVYDPKPAISKGACGVARPVLLRAFGEAKIKMAPVATVNCNLTAALAKWADQVVAPAARRHLGVGVVSVRNMASYACRRRNNSKRGRISEHAFANALDVGTFNLADGGQVSVGKHWRGGGAKQAFLREVHKKSCGVFKTVLGPNSDRFHSRHFHLDLAKRRSTYCR